MITTRKIDEWIREVEDRPASAREIIRLIANRLAELENINEQLRDENIQLRLGQKVEEYQRRIDNLEYQLDLLKRQLTPETPQEAARTNLILYNPKGQVLRIETDFRDAGSGNVVGRFRQPIEKEALSPHLLLVEETEEALFLFDSGRVSSGPVDQIPKFDPRNLDWESAFLMEPGIGEELVRILPSARMSLYEYCVQASRRGHTRKVIENFFENHLSRGFIGSGVSLETDRTCGLTFGDREDTFVMVSHEGIVFSMEVAELPSTVEEAVKLSPSDHIISIFTLRDKSSILLITQNGKIIHREIGWLEPANALKTKGQPVLSKERRAAGIRIVGAAPVNERDLGIALLEDGQILTYPLESLFASGSIFEDEQTAVVLSFGVLNIQPE